MYNKLQRDDAYKAKLMRFTSEHYKINPLSIASANRGFYGETWKINCGDVSYFLKLVDATPCKRIYENSFALVNYLTTCDLDFVPKLIKTKTGELFALFDNAVLGVFEWIEGENIQNEATKKAEYNMLTKIYALNCPISDIAKEDFSNYGAIEFYNRLKGINCTDLNTFFESIADIITHRANRLRDFSNRCKGNTSHFYITHGDAGGNVIQNDNTFYLVDWDTSKLAPPERDAWFCMGWQWAIELFEKSLFDAGIYYRLDSERLAYYAYYYYFYYFNEYLKAYEYLVDKRILLLNDIKSFSTGWIEESFIYADKIE